MKPRSVRDLLKPSNLTFVQACANTSRTRPASGSYCLVRRFYLSPDLTRLHQSPRPGLREHFIFSPHRYATNRFMENFRMAIRFAWPYETESAYKLDHRTELYSFTSTYIDRQWQIKYWQMDPKFFDLFPELRTEVPSAVPAPSNLFVGFEFDEPSNAREHSNEKWNVGQ